MGRFGGSTMKQYVLSAVLIAGILGFGTVSPAAAVNEDTTVVLHAVEEAGPCDQVVNCFDALPRVDVSSMSSPSIMVILRNYDRVHGIQIAFEWDPSWSLASGSWDCQAMQLSAVQPSEPGARAGTITTAFNVITEGEAAVIGQLTFASAPSGCLRLVDSAFPYGNHVVDITSDPPHTILDPQLWGKVCAGPGGYNTCYAPTPVNSETWGAIRARYR